MTSAQIHLSVVIEIARCDPHRTVNRDIVVVADAEVFTVSPVDGHIEHLDEWMGVHTEDIDETVGIDVPAIDSLDSAFG